MKTRNEKFGTPSAEEAEEATEPESDAQDSFDDLFGQFDPSSEQADEQPAAGSIDSDQAAARPNAGEVTATVTTRSKSASVDPLQQTQVRTWIDDTGYFRTDGRLIEINDESIRLLKANGRTCTVPMERLSEADAAYVDSLRQSISQPVFAMATR